MSDELKLIRPTLALKDEFLAMAEEFQAEGSDRFRRAIEDFPGYVGWLEDMAAGRALPSGYVPASTYWLVADGQRIVGGSGLRHRLNENLRHEGGHIGYAVRSSERRKGHGTRILALTLIEARALDLKRVLVTCDTDNVASARIIEKNGGQLANRVVSKESGKPVSRYWIDL